MTTCRVIVHRFIKFVLGILHGFIKFVMSMLIMWGQSNEDPESADHVHVDSTCTGSNLLEIEEMPAIDEHR
jgi:hypothetical protein